MREKTLYARLAWTGMRKNRRLYLPYLLSCAGMVLMFYILMGLSGSPVLEHMSGGGSSAIILRLGTVVIAVFALIFLFYTHSFLIRRREREFGLYNVLGMGKGNIARILLWETVITYGLTTGTGLLLGMVLYKLAELGMVRLLQVPVTYTLTVSVSSLLAAAALFAVIHTLILLNSLKKEGTFTTSTVFQLPTKETFAGLSNYVYGVTKMGFLSSLGYSLVITVSSVALILLCCSMTGWYLTRVNNKLSKFMNLLIVFSMVVPFQMVMFTLSKTADRLNLNNPWNICIIYLGFGAGLAVFMFTGFMKSVPMEIEEAAMIDGCNPIQIFFKVVFPILKPTMISTAILETMWVWNDYLLPTLVLDIKKYRTIPMAIQYFRGGYGRVELAPMMACIIIAILPIIILYMTCQKYIIEGVVAGAVKG